MIDLDIEVIILLHSLFPPASLINQFVLMMYFLVYKTVELNDITLVLDEIFTV